jgi:formylglycine-generating enzyme required for sulfatase activity
MTNAADPPDDVRATLDDLVDDVMRRRGAGERLSDAAIIRAHPHLAPHLAAELALLDRLQRARDAAEAAGPLLDAPIVPMSDADLDRPIEDDASMTDEDAGHAGTPSPPLSIPGLVLCAEIGRGGQAVVYRAVQEATGRPVAVKAIIGGAFIGADVLARYERECRVLAALEHPSIVGILDKGRTADGSRFFVMDLIAGPTLSEWVDRNRADSPTFARDLLRLFVKVARAVDAAHRVGVVHRDLKPANVRVDAYGEPHVLDFGLAWDASARPSHDVTQAGQLLGSLPWSSPEQASGDPCLADATSDVYALALMLYHAVAGRFPYAATGDVRSVLNAIATAPPAPLPRVPTFGRRVVRDLNAVLLAALQKRQSDRLPTAARLADELELILAGRAPSSRQRQRRKRRRAVAGAVGAAALTVLVAWSSLRPEPPLVFDLPRTTNSIGQDMVRLPAASFVMGSPTTEAWRQPNEAQRLARIDRRFWMSTAEVTTSQYRQVMGADAALPGASDAPATRVSAAAAREFCRRLSEREGQHYRLPTETEWEFACRAGNADAFPYGRAEDYVWHAGNAREPRPVARKRPNVWGLYDMHGNAAELCESDAADLLNATYVVVRGGSFATDLTGCRAATRSSLAGDRARADVGFRIVREDKTRNPREE